MSDSRLRSSLSNEADITPTVRIFDLEERSAVFGESVIEFLKEVSATCVSAPLIRQLARSATSVGANYCEADDAASKADFKDRISICQKESRESKYWLRMIAAAEAFMKDEARTLWREARELHLIFCSVRRKTMPIK